MPKTYENLNKNEMSYTLRHSILQILHAFINNHILGRLIVKNSGYGFEKRTKSLLYQSIKTRLVKMKSDLLELLPLH